MHILFVTSELAPFTGDNPSASAAGALPKALQALGHDVTIVAPYYASANYCGLTFSRRLSPCSVQLDGGKVDCRVYESRTAAGVELTLLGNAQLFDKYTYPLPASSRSVLELAAQQIASEREVSFDAVHLNGLELAGFAHQQREATVVISGYKNELEEDRLSDLSEQTEAGMRQADWWVLPSPSLASELVARPPSCIAETVGSKKDFILGIQGGIDESYWNPATDPLIRQHYDSTDIHGKTQAKQQLREELQLPPSTEPLFLFIADTTKDASAGVLDALVAMDKRLRGQSERAPEHGLQWIVLAADAAGASERVGSGANGLAASARVHPLGDQAFLHRALAGADFVVIPRAAYGAEQLALQAQCYGALPIGASELLRDAVVDCDTSLRSGTGFLYDAGPEALADATGRAQAAFRQEEAFGKLIARVMHQDHSWERAARLYDSLYAAKGFTPDLVARLA